MSPGLAVDVLHTVGVWRMEVLFYNDAYLDSMVEFIRNVWDERITGEIFSKRRAADQKENPYAGEEGIPIAIVVDGNRIVGRLSAIPCRLWSNDEEHPMCWLSGLHILPEFRGRRLAPLLPKLMTDNFSIVTGFFVQEAPLRIYNKLGWTIVGKIPEYIKILDVRSFFEKFDIGHFDRMLGRKKELARILCATGRIGGAFLPSFLFGCYSTFQKMRSAGERPVNVEIVENFDRRVDELWGRNKTFIKHAQVRTAAYLNWHFKSQVGWIKVISRKDDEINGYAILSIRKFSEDDSLRDMKVLSIIDIFWNLAQPHVFTGMVRSIENLARERGADVMLCSIHEASSGKMLKRSAFFKIPSTVYFGYHSSRAGLKLPAIFDDWFVTRGDADAAGNLAPDSGTHRKPIAKMP